MTSAGHERSLGTLMAIARTRVAADKKTGATTPPGILALAALVDEKAIVVSSDHPHDVPSVEDELSPLGDNYVQVDVPVRLLPTGSKKWPRRISSGTYVLVSKGDFNLGTSSADEEVPSPGVVRYTSTVSSSKG